MENKTITIGKFILSKEGISISRKWYRKERFIAWDNVQRIGRDKNALKVWYSSQTGKIKAISLIYEGKYKKLLDYWRDILVEDLATKGEICGSSLHEKWLGIIVIIGLIPLGFFGYHLFIIISSLLKWCMDGWPEIQQITKWFLYYLVVPIGFFLAYPLSFLISSLRQTHIIGRWKSWKIAKDGLFVQTEFGRWEKVTLRSGDRISPDKIIAGGKYIPLVCNLGGASGGFRGGLTKNVVVPHLLGILAKRQGISPMPGKKIILLRQHYGSSSFGLLRLHCFGMGRCCFGKFRSHSISR